jgi:hypothetical protein
VSDWYQQSLTPPEIIELRARIGVIPERDHVQALVEAVEPTSGAQVAQWSVPHAPLAEVHLVVEQVVVKLRELLEETVDPF